MNKSMEWECKSPKLSIDPKRNWLTDFEEASWSLVSHHRAWEGVGVTEIRAPWDSMYLHAQLLQLGPTLYDTMDCSPPGSSVHGIFQARILEWVAMTSSRGSSQPRGWTCTSYVSCTGRWFFFFFPLVPPGKPRQGVDSFCTFKQSWCSTRAQQSAVPAGAREWGGSHVTVSPYLPVGWKAQLASSSSRLLPSFQLQWDD